MYEEILYAFILGALPISEVRGAAIYAFSMGQPWLIIPGILGNILACPAILVLWDVINIPWFGKKILGSRVEAKMKQMGEKYQVYGMLGIAVFVGIPLPITGVYSATLIAMLLQIRRAHILQAAVIGVLAAAVIMYLALSGIFSFLPA
ncbi:MAG: small multi-drug export protein [Candidatus Micrarchaeota archaeon]